MEVVLDEAVRLAKRYASDDASRLVNGFRPRRARAGASTAENRSSGPRSCSRSFEETRAELSACPSRRTSTAPSTPSRGSRSWRRKSRPSPARPSGGRRCSVGRTSCARRSRTTSASRALTPELHGLEEPVRHALAGGGKRCGRVLCLRPQRRPGHIPTARPAAAAVELVHNFSLVHDDLPALDDDDERRGRPTVHVRFGEDVAVLTGDALLTEAFRLALSYGAPGVAHELAQATLGMIGGQYLDLRGEGVEADALNRLKTGRLFDAAVACGLWAAEVPEPSQQPWRRLRRRARSSSRRSTTSSTATARRGRAARPGHGRPRTTRPRGPSRRSRRSRPTRPSSPRSWTPWPRARPERPLAPPAVAVSLVLVKKRADVLLVERGLAESRAQAQALVLAGLVPGGEAGPAARRGDAAGRRAGPAARLPWRRQARERARCLRDRRARPQRAGRGRFDRRFLRTCSSSAGSLG